MLSKKRLWRQSQASRVREGKRMWTRVRSVLLWTVCAAMSLALAACGDDGGKSDSLPDPPPAANNGAGDPDHGSEATPEDEGTGVGEEAGQEDSGDDPVLHAMIEEMIQSMSPSEKIGQLVMIGVEGEAMDETVSRLIAKRHAGGVILYGRNLTSVTQAVSLIDDLKAVNRSNDAPLLIGIDEEGGRVTRLPGELAKTPASRDIGSRDDPEWTYAVGELIGEKLAAFGINVNFAPVLDIDSNPQNPVIGDRAFGSDPDRVSVHGIASMRGMAQYVVPVVKHFPGHGDTHEDSHVDLPVVSHDAERLRSFELQPFQRAIASGADAVMVAHLLVPAYDEQYPASLSKPIITDLLREELGFDGVVVTDDMTMGAIAEHDEFATAVVDAVLAGADQILIGHGYDRAESAIEALEEAFLSGVLSAERLEESVRRVLKLKIKYGMNDDPVGSVDIEALNEHAARVLGE